MARKTLGFVNLIWTCPFCQTQNPGPIKSCSSCGAPQPPNVHFEEVDKEKFDFIKDEALIRMAKSGPDKHCPYCGTRNLATAERCVECGSDITVGAQARAQGQKVGTPIQEDAAGDAAPPKKKLSKGCLIGVIIAVVLLCIGSVAILINTFKTETNQGTVFQTSWQRMVTIEGVVPVNREAWLDEVPAEANLGSCTMQYRFTSEEPQPNATETCGEPYTIDTGTGVGKVVQDCTYDVYDDYCSYSGYVWDEVDTVSASGGDLSPYWPDVSLTSTERLGEQTEQYTIYFKADGSQYTFTTSSLALYQQATTGSVWDLEITNSGDVRTASPK